jgi:hypothetical protein
MDAESYRKAVEDIDMPHVPSDHLVHLRRRPFVFRCSTSIFPADELAALFECGNWMEALATGTIAPVSAEQEHFLLVDREEAEPVTLCERAWLRLKGRREYEQEEAATAPPAPPDNYGMVEFDADRCWW